MKKLYQQLFAIFLLVFMGGTLLFTINFREPFPAIYQPAFRSTTADLNNAKSQTADLFAVTDAGERIEIQYGEIFEYAPYNREAFLFYQLSDSSLLFSQTTFSSSKDYTFYKKLKKLVVDNYQQKMRRKKQNQYAGLLNYLENRAEAITSKNVVKLELSLYLSTQYFDSHTAKKELMDTKIIRF